MDTTTETGRSKRNLQRMGSSVVSLDPVTVLLVGQGGLGLPASLVTSQEVRAGLARRVGCGADRLVCRGGCCVKKCSFS